MMADKLTRAGGVTDGADAATVALATGGGEAGTADGAAGDAGAGAPIWARSKLAAPAVAPCAAAATGAATACVMGADGTGGNSPAGACAAVAATGAAAGVLLPDAPLGRLAKPGRGGSSSLAICTGRADGTNSGEGEGDGDGGAGGGDDRVLAEGGGVKIAPGWRTDSRTGFITSGALAVAAATCEAGGADASAPAGDGGSG